MIFMKFASEVLHKYCRVQYLSARERPTITITCAWKGIAILGCFAVLTPCEDWAIGRLWWGDNDVAVYIMYWQCVEVVVV